VHVPKEYELAWSGGYKELFTSPLLKNNYEHIYITDKYGQPYIYYLFYNQYPPDVYQSQVNKQSFNNIEFRWIDWPQFQYLDNTLLVADPKEITEIPADSKFSQVGEIKTKKDEVLFRLLQSK
jgi:hypothetical protein